MRVYGGERVYVYVCVFSHNCTKMYKITIIIKEL